MHFSTIELLQIGAIMTLASTVQGAVGFAAGMIGVPLLVLMGMSLPEAVTVNLIASMVQQLIGCWRLRFHLEARELVLPVLLRWLMIPAGIYAAWWLTQNSDPEVIKFLIGAVLLGTLALLSGLRITPQEQIGFLWQVLAFCTSGFFMGFAVMGGGPMVVYVNSLKWSASKSRAFLFFCAATGWPVAAALFWWRYGEELLPAARAAILVLPFVVGGLWLGLELGHRLSKRLFRKLSYGLLLAIAIYSIATPWIVGRTY